MYLHVVGLVVFVFLLGNCQVESTIKTTVTIIPANPEAGKEVQFLCKFELRRNKQVTVLVVKSFKEYLRVVTAMLYWYHTQFR